MNEYGLMYLSISSLKVDYREELVLQEIPDINYQKSAIVLINGYLLLQAYNFLIKFTKVNLIKNYK